MFGCVWVFDQQMARTKQTARRKTEDDGEAAGPNPTPTKVWVEAESGVEKGRKRAKVEKTEKGAKVEKAETVEKVEIEK